MCAEPSPNQKDGKPPDPNCPEIIPFQLGAHLKLRPLADPDSKGHTKVIGVVHKDVIMVEEPVFEVEGERISGRVGCDILCSYFVEGWLYRFKSRFGQGLAHNIVCIEYPRHIEAKNLRKHPRIKVNLEAMSLIGKDGRLINSIITDISKGGCCLELPGIIPLTPRIPVSLTFELPNDDQVEELSCTVMNLRHVPAEKKTITGVSFATPSEEIVKVIKFCEMCMYFRV